ncbi:MAG: hypothetical protein ACLTKE_07610 [Coprococcus sp.]
MSGDVMCDAVLYYSKMLDEKPADYYFAHLEGTIWGNYACQRMVFVNNSSSGKYRFD